MKVLLFWFICFVVYSFLGWICETFFCSAAQRRFVNRGFLNGPFCPIYGFGALLVIGLFSKYENDLLALFLLSMAVTSIVEYIASVLLEKLFHLTLGIIPAGNGTLTAGCACVIRCCSAFFRC